MWPFLPGSSALILKNQVPPTSSWLLRTSHNLGIFASGYLRHRVTDSDLVNRFKSSRFWFLTGSSIFYSDSAVLKNHHCFLGRPAARCSKSRPQMHQDVCALRIAKILIKQVKQLARTGTILNKEIPDLLGGVQLHFLCKCCSAWLIWLLELKKRFGVNQLGCSKLAWSSWSCQESNNPSWFSWSMQSIWRSITTSETPSGIFEAGVIAAQPRNEKCWATRG